MTTLMATGVGPDGTKVWNPTAFTKGFCGYSKTVKCAVRNEGTKLCECGRIKGDGGLKTDGREKRRERFAGEENASRGSG